MTETITPDFTTYDTYVTFLTDILQVGLRHHKKFPETSEISTDFLVLKPVQGSYIELNMVVNCKNMD